MLKEPTKPLHGPALSEEVYHLALERIKALLGCTGDLPEKRELIDWATIADAYEHRAHSNDDVLAATALAPPARQPRQEASARDHKFLACSSRTDDPGLSEETAITGLVELFVETLG